eukprot:1966461-Alexandrium_andersonii.AAC.1
MPALVGGLGIRTKAYAECLPRELRRPLLRPFPCPCRSSFEREKEPCSFGMADCELRRFAAPAVREPIVGFTLEVLYSISSPNRLAYRRPC